MSVKNIESTYKLFNKSLGKNRLGNALSHLTAMASIANSPWQITGDIDRIRESYGYLCNYALDGVDDPGRAAIMADLKSEMLRISTMILRHSEIEDSPRQYFSILRYESLQDDSSLIGLLHQYKDDYSRYVKELLLSNALQKANMYAMRKSLDAQSVRLFNIIWTTFPFSKDISSEIESALMDESLSSVFKEVILSAVMLGALEYYDEERLVLLARIYLDSVPRMEMKALVGLMLGLWMHRSYIGGKRLQDILNTIYEKTGWKEDLKTVFLELVRTRDTERISHTLQDEIIPKMMKMRPDLLKNSKMDIADEEFGAMEMNPEWEEMFEKSGLADKLKELSELQADGGDVMMNTFAHLKSFPFFNDAANWFLPFDVQNSSVAEIVDDTSADIVELISSSPMMCEGDKYSLVLSLERIPAANRRMMLNQFKLQDINLSELRMSELNPEMSDRRNICNKYIQDIYRFFNLYRRKGDFNNPFNKSINLSAISLLSEQFDDSDILTVVGEFYFKRGYWSDALDVFNILESRNSGSAQLLQKIGYCYQQTGDIVKAIDKYKRSELFRPDSLWVMRKLAQCYRTAGDYESALQYYDKIALQKPDDLKITLSMGHCYLDTNDYDNALKCYYKYEYLSSTPEKVLRPIAWCLFRTGDYDRCNSYYEKILIDNPSSSDYLNMGHLYMAQRRFREAVNSYQISRQLWPSGNDSFTDHLESERIYLESAGVNGDLIDIVYDKITE